VVEEREKVFATAPVPKAIRRQVSEPEGTTRIVYLPRVRYKIPPDVERCMSALEHLERRRHFVTAHLRKTEHASQEQIQLARLYGFVVPTGYTFVRPHERCSKEVEVIYRSRSALQSLYEVEERPAGGAGPAHWFQFERDVTSVMHGLRYDVQHVAAGRHGDQGIDVYATKGEAERVENWVIQCKCYSPHRKVGPSVVRELRGVLSKYQGARGMIVTTSTFTAGAVNEATKAGIRMIAGDEFSRLCRQHREKNMCGGYGAVAK
jgi:hypothetical protein